MKTFFLIVLIIYLLMTVLESIKIIKDFKSISEKIKKIFGDKGIEFDDKVSDICTYIAVGLYFTVDILVLVALIIGLICL